MTYPVECRCGWRRPPTPDRIAAGRAVVDHWADRSYAERHRSIWPNGLWP